VKLFNLAGKFFFVLLLVIIFQSDSISAAISPVLNRTVAEKPVYKSLPQNENNNEIVFKLKEGMGQPEFKGQKFIKTGEQWDKINSLIYSNNKARSIAPRISTDKSTLDQMRLSAMAKSGSAMADMTLYYQINLESSMTAEERVDLINEINSLDIIEIAYFAPKPSPASIDEVKLTPVWESFQYYLQPAPTGIDAYYGWNFPGGKGEGIKVIDIEGNWIQTHEDLHGGIDNFHIGGTRIDDPGWYNHGTAVLGEIAADSNNFGMTGIAFNVDLGTISIGSMSTAQALILATNNSDTGDIILIELHAPGPHYNFEDYSGQLGYVAMEYWQENFDAILQASALGRIVVEAAGNGAEDFDDANIYGSVFDPSVRFSGAIMVGASNSSHQPASFTNYGERVDVHAFGTWDVYTLGYGDLYGSGPDNDYTHSFAGTSSASPIIVGACAILEGISLNNRSMVLHHDELREFLTTYSTPQAASPKHIGPLPDLAAAIEVLIGVWFTADTTVGWIPFDINFSGNSTLNVDIWNWNFGDGNTSSLQSPTHTYNTQGWYTVGLQIDAAGDIRNSQRQNYVIALADSITTKDSIQGNTGATIEVVIKNRNTLPLGSIQIPIEYNGDLDLDFVSYSTAGCRTDYFTSQQIIHSDTFVKRLTIKLTTSALGTLPDLPPGEGDIIKLYFSIPASGQIDETSTISFDGYNSYLPSFFGRYLDYDIKSTTSTISICVPRGDVDGSPGIFVSDLTFLVDYLFKGGVAPNPYISGDVNCVNNVNVADLTYLVNYLFKGGPPPCGC